MNTVGSVGYDSQSKLIGASIHIAAATGMATHEHKMVRVRIDCISRFQHDHNATMVLHFFKWSLNFYISSQIKTGFLKGANASTK